MSTEVPVIFGVVTTDNIEQAIERAELRLEIKDMTQLLQQ